MLRGCFHPGWRSPFVKVTAKQHWCVVRAAALHSVKTKRQASSAQVKSRAICRVLLRANLHLKAADWRPSLLVLQAIVLQATLVSKAK